ncbi:Small integral membrane protein 31 [Dissostichus eleginoides]|uniref:Small integral membrane protein 31 n=1 Tax=Dissostichus eleginoides TaxID=100907 RepID=A0AAD9BLG4_DISEL|nr:Small integral membrane protein 31 [Dissostichus eleginoides]
MASPFTELEVLTIGFSLLVFALFTLTGILTEERVHSNDFGDNPTLTGHTNTWTHTFLWDLLVILREEVLLESTGSSRGWPSKSGLKQQEKKENHTEHHQPQGLSRLLENCHSLTSSGANFCPAMRVFNLLYLLLLLVALLTSVSSARPGGDTTDTTTAHTDAACLSTPEYPFPKLASSCVICPSQVPRGGALPS